MRLFILLFLLIFFDKASAQNIIKINSNSPYENLGKQVSFYVDKHELSLSDIVRLDHQGAFRRGKKDVLNLGPNPGNVWIKIRYENQSDLPAYLVYDIGTIEYVNLYKNISGTNKYQVLKAGSLSDVQQTAMRSSRYIFSLDQNSHNRQPETLYLKLKSNNIMIAPIKLATADKFVQEMVKKRLIDSTFIGILLALFCFNIFNYANFKDKSFLYYSLYVLFTSIYLMLYLRGYGYILGENSSRLINTYPHVFLGISVISVLAFSKGFLNIARILPKALSIFRVLVVIWSIIMLVNLLGYKTYGSAMAQVFSFLTTIFLWIIGFIAYKQGFKPARFYLLAWSFIGAYIITVVFNLTPWFHYNEMVMQIMPICFALDLLLLSFALNDRYKEFKRQNLYLIRTQNERLEQLVQERTNQLNQTVNRLEQSNLVKNKLFTIVAHDLRSPFSSLHGMLSLYDDDLISADEMHDFLKTSRSSIENMQYTLNNLLHWAKSQMDGVSSQQVKFSIQSILDTLLPIYEPLASKKGISIQLDIKGSTDVYADENQISLVLRNLIDNAIKFTPLKKFVSIQMEELPNEVAVSISNPVENLDESRIFNSFTNLDYKPSYGTANEKGVGLGLSLCSEYVAMNGGKLEFELDNNVLKFLFRLSKKGYANAVIENNNFHNKNHGVQDLK